MAPADLRKSGAHYDLPRAIGILCASGQIDHYIALSKTLFLGELSLDGSLRPLKGVLPIVRTAAEQGIESVILPSKNASEAAIIPELSIYAFDHLKDVLAHMDPRQAKEIKTSTVQSNVCPAGGKKAMPDRPSNQDQSTFVQKSGDSSQAMKHLGLYARAYHRVIKVARTIADMDQSREIKVDHMAEALQYRVLDRQTG